MLRVLVKCQPSPDPACSGIVQSMNTILTGHCLLTSSYFVPSLTISLRSKQPKLIYDYSYFGISLLLVLVSVKQYNPRYTTVSIHLVVTLGVDRPISVVTRYHSCNIQSSI